MSVYKTLFFHLFQFLPSRVDAMTIEDYRVVKANVDERLEDVATM